MKKGILLAGGSGSRLRPSTLVVSKQLLPVYDKPMVYYPLSSLMLAGIREILVVSTPEDRPLFERLLGDGSAFGIQIEFATQPKPEGIAQAFLIAETWTAGEPVALALGDNIFFGHGFSEALRQAAQRETGATVLAHHVHDPERYGVLDLGGDGRVRGIVEKPPEPPSNWAVTGLYFYDARVTDIARSLEPSARGELEITDVNRRYLELGDLNVAFLGRGVTWLDTGTHESLMQASNFIHAVQERQGLQVACPEEIAYRAAWIDADALARQAEALGNTPYADSLRQLLQAPVIPQSPR